MMMTPFFSAHHFAVFFGLMGNAVSFLVFLSPAPTFYRIYKAKSTEEFKSLPYAVALFSSMLTLYYGLIKSDNGTLLITINSVGIVIQSFYLTVFLIYAPAKTKLKTLRMLMTFNVGLLGLIILLTSLLTHGPQKEHVIGWICAICSVCFFASPLSVIKTVIKTKSVEFMPFWLSFSLTVSAVMWFSYGFFTKDKFVALPNVLGLAFGITQMTLYFIYKDSTKKKGVAQEDDGHIIDIGKLVVIELKPEAQIDENNEEDDIIEVGELVVFEVKPEAVVDGKKEEDEEDGRHVSSCATVVGPDPLVDEKHTIVAPV